MHIMKLTEPQVITGIKELIEDQADSPINTPSEAESKLDYLVSHLAGKRYMYQTLDDVNQLYNIIELTTGSFRYHHQDYIVRDSVYFAQELEEHVNGPFDKKDYQVCKQTLDLVNNNPQDCFVQKACQMKAHIMNTKDVILLLKQAIGIVKRYHDTPINVLKQMSSQEGSDEIMQYGKQAVVQEKRRAMDKAKGINCFKTLRALDK